MLSGLGLALSLEAGATNDAPFLKASLATEADDYAEFYSVRTLLYLGGGLAAGALLAHTAADRDIREWYQEDVRSGDTDTFADSTKWLGESMVVGPVFAGAWLTGLIVEDNAATGAIGEWGNRSLRSVLVGGPPLLAFQRILGSGRPHEGVDSDWIPFQDDNAVSGHAFLGAIPFLSAARMTDNRLAKTLLYAGSTLAGLSRVNDDEHYTSQVLLGWWLAYLSEACVDRNGAHRMGFEPMPTVIDGHPGIAFAFAF